MIVLADREEPDLPITESLIVGLDDSKDLTIILLDSLNKMFL